MGFWNMGFQDPVRGDQGERARDAKVQIDKAGPEIPGCPCCCFQSIQPGKALGSG